MKMITLFVSFLTLFTSQAFAHTDHALGEGAFHGFYHAVFWLIFAVVAVKGFIYFQKKKHDNKSSSKQSIDNK